MALPEWARSATPDGRFSSAGGGIGRGLSLNFLAGLFQLFGAALSTVILSRILSPEDFGVYGMILPFVSILVLLIDGGSIYYMLRSEKVVEREATDLFWYALCCSTAGMLLLMLAMPGIAWAMDEPHVLGAGLVAALTLLFNGLGFQHAALIMRCFRNDLRALAIIGGVIVGVAAGVAIALAGGGYWALIALLSFRVLATSLLYVFLSGWRPGPPHWDRALLKDVFRLARPTLRGRIALSLVRESDKIFVGLLFSTSQTGFYAFAQMLSVVPLQQVISPTFSVVLPWLSEIKENRVELFERFWAFLCNFIFLFLAPCLFGSFFADSLFALVLGPEMAPAASPFRILVVSAAAALAYDFTSLSFQAVDRPDIPERQQYGMMLVFLLLYAAASLHPRFEMIAVAVLVGNILTMGIRLRGVFRHFEAPVAGPMLRLARSLLLSFVPAALVLGLAEITGSLTGIGDLDTVLYSALFTVIYAALAIGAFGLNPMLLLRRRRRPA
ncbi:MAG: oligosaccharide flippase family protein [Pikeienuella sp.]